VEADITDLVHNAIKLQGRNIDPVAPTADQALAWDDPTSKWMPKTLIGMTQHGNEWHDPDMALLSDFNTHVANPDAHHATHLKTLADHPLSVIPVMDDAHIPDVETLSYTNPFAVTQIPDLPATKITSQILAAARGGLGKALSPTWTNDYIPVYKTATDQWVMEAKPAAGKQVDTYEVNSNAAWEPGLWTLDPVCTVTIPATGKATKLHIIYSTRMIINVTGAEMGIMIRCAGANQTNTQRTQSTPVANYYMSVSTQLIYSWDGASDITVVGVGRGGTGADFRPRGISILCIY